MAKNSPSNATKAGTLLCPTCCVEYIEVQLDFEVEGAVLRSVEALRCPRCGEEVFSPKQQEAVKKHLGLE